MTKKPDTPSSDTPNSHLSMSPSARTLMRAREKAVYHYYNDMGKRRGNCTWGAGILAHRGICTDEELSRQVSTKMVGQEFDRRVSEAERAVRRNVRTALTQEQFDALCSLTYNTGPSGASGTYDFVNDGDFEGAAANISKLTKVKITKGGKARYVVAPGQIQRRAEESAPFRTTGKAKDPSK
jgi:lysozyme